MRTGKDVSCKKANPPTYGGKVDGVCDIPDPPGAGVTYNVEVLQTMPWPSYHNMTDTDWKAIDAYLSALPQTTACNTPELGCPGFKAPNGGVYPKGPNPPLFYAYTEHRRLSRTRRRRNTRAATPRQQPVAKGRSHGIGPFVSPGGTNKADAAVFADALAVALSRITPKLAFMRPVLAPVGRACWIRLPAEDSVKRKQNQRVHSRTQASFALLLFARREHRGSINGD
jgi:hypothetical protein